MSEDVWFSADSHYFHAAQLRDDRCARPFKDVEEMNETLVKNWNDCVKNSDRAYFLGDFSFGNAILTTGILGQLNGNIHLILGNHDKNINAALRKQFASVSQIKEVRIQGQKIVMCHYAFVTWPGIYENAFSLHGHSHSSLEVSPTAKRLDVGVDNYAKLFGKRPENYRPFHFDEIKTIMDAKLPWVPVDHHRVKENF